MVKILKLKFGRNADLRFRNLIKIYLRSRYFGKQNLTLGSVVPLAMFFFYRIAPPLVIVEDCFEKLFLKNILFEDGMETCRVLNLFKRKAERF